MHDSWCMLGEKKGIKECCRSFQICGISSDFQGFLSAFIKRRYIQKKKKEWDESIFSAHDGFRRICSTSELWFPTKSFMHCSARSSRCAELRLGHQDTSNSSSFVDRLRKIDLSTSVTSTLWDGLPALEQKNLIFDKVSLTDRKSCWAHKQQLVFKDTEHEGDDLFCPSAMSGFNSKCNHFLLQQYNTYHFQWLHFNSRTIYLTHLRQYDVIQWAEVDTGPFFFFLQKTTQVVWAWNKCLDQVKIPTGFSGNLMN